MPSCITRHRLQRRLLTLYLHQRHCQRICRRHLQQRDRLSQRPLCWRKVCRFYGRTQREACTSFGRSSGACWQVARLRDWRACLCDRRNMSPDGAPLLQSCLCLPDVLTAHCLRDVLTAHVPPGTCRLWALVGSGYVRRHWTTARHRMQASAMPMARPGTVDLYWQR